MKLYIESNLHTTIETSNGIEQLPALHCMNKYNIDDLLYMMCTSKNYEVLNIRIRDEQFIKQYGYRFPS